MIPVMTSTKTDKLAIDLAGVETGAKIFVPGEDELWGSLAHITGAVQNRRSVVCVSNRSLDEIAFNIDVPLFPLSTSEIRAITKLRNPSLLLPFANRAP